MKSKSLAHEIISRHEKYYVYIEMCFNNKFKFRTLHMEGVIRQQQKTKQVENEKKRQRNMF